MAGRAWACLMGVIAALLLAVMGLDQWQVRQGEVSLFGLGRPAGPGQRSPDSLPLSLGSRPADSAPPRVAVIVDDLGARRDVFEALRDAGRPLSVAVLPEMPVSRWIAAEAARVGFEVLLDLPMEPYRFPEVDPGPGAVTMAMALDDVSRLVGRHLTAIPAAVGVTIHLGSRVTEDRNRMRAALEPLKKKRLFFVDTMTSNLSVAYDEARRLGLRAGRRQLLIDHADGEGDRRVWEQAGRLAARRGEAIVIVHGHPLTARLLRDYIPRWEAQGVRLVPASHLVR
jgi:polysaccharide deacetylase 2 family uncharacterized protein YibQ